MAVARRGAFVPHHPVTARARGRGLVQFAELAPGTPRRSIIYLAESLLELFAPQFVFFSPSLD